MVKRKGKTEDQPEEYDIDELSLDPITSEMDDLSDALSAELSGESDDELSDANLFGDEELMDDVLSDELEDSLGDSLDDPLEDSAVELLSDEEVTEDEVAQGSEVDEQDDLDNLFDEDELLATVDEDPQLEGDDELEADLLAEAQDGDKDADLDSMLIEDGEEEVLQPHIEESEVEQAAIKEPAIETDESVAGSENTMQTSAVVDEEERPEISIDELLQEPEKEAVDNPIMDEADDINEVSLQNLDKEIASQNVQS